MNAKLTLKKNTLYKLEDGRGLIVRSNFYDLGSNKAYAMVEIQINIDNCKRYVMQTISRLEIKQLFGLKKGEKIEII